MKTASGRQVTVRHPALMTAYLRFTKPETEHFSDVRLKHAPRPANRHGFLPPFTIAGEVGKQLTYAAVERQGMPRQEIPESIASYCRNAIPTFKAVVTFEIAMKVLSLTSDQNARGVFLKVPAGEMLYVGIAFNDVMNINLQISAGLL